MDILAVQQRFLDAGFQFSEHVYNDGMTRAGELVNCSIKFAKDTSPHNLSADLNPTGDFGWGRFNRMHAWRMAAEWLDKHESGE